MTRSSAPDLLVLHAVRITGHADTGVLADRFGLDHDSTEEHLGDVEARGWVRRTGFADVVGWSLTEAGRAENERQLAAELAGTGQRAEVGAAYADFLPLNGRLQQACTDWQLRPADGDRFAVNDHTDPAWDRAVLTELGALSHELGPLNSRLVAVLPRFDGYSARFDSALVRARSGEDAFVDRTDVDSCHGVWFELHEDLVATLGIDRGNTA